MSYPCSKCRMNHYPGSMAYEKHKQYAPSSTESVRAPKYEIRIFYPNWEGYTYGIALQKLYGDYLGTMGEVKTKEEALDRIKNMIEKWERHDSILNRMGDKVTPKNTDFESFTTDITKMEVFGVSRIESFLYS